MDCKVDYSCNELLRNVKSGEVFYAYCTKREIRSSADTSSYAINFADCDEREGKYDALNKIIAIKTSISMDDNWCACVDLKSGDLFALSKKKEVCTVSPSYVDADGKMVFN